MNPATAQSLFGLDVSLEAHGQTFEILSTYAWVFRLARELKTPNRSIWRGAMALAADRAAWQRAFEKALHTWRAYGDYNGYSAVERVALPHVQRHREHRKLTVRRLVPHERNFIRDDDNLQFAPKHLRDALTRVRLIVDDADAWITRAPVTQHVSPDGQYYTVVLLERPRLREA